MVFFSYKKNMQILLFFFGNHAGFKIKTASEYIFSII